MTFNELEQAVQFMAYQFSPSPLYSTQQQQQQQQQLMASAPNPYSGRDMSPQRSLESGPGYSGPYAQYGRDISPQRSLESVPPYAQYGRDLTPQRSMQSVPAYDAPNAQYARDPSPPRSMQSGPAYDVPHAQYGRDLSPRRSMQGVPGYTGPQAPYGRDSSRPRSWAGEDPYGWPSRRFAGQGGGPDSWGSAYEDAGGPASTSPHTSHGSMSDAAMYGGAVPAGAYPRSSSPPPPHFDSTPAAGGVRFRDDAMGSVDAQRFDEAVFSQAGRYTGGSGTMEDVGSVACVFDQMHLEHVCCALVLLCDMLGLAVRHVGACNDRAYCAAYGSYGAASWGSMRHMWELIVRLVGFTVDMTGLTVRHIGVYCVACWGSPWATLSIVGGMSGLLMQLAQQALSTCQGCGNGRETAPG
eukprot:1161325-Pelagomonas_calceolata.AAC.13